MTPGQFFSTIGNDEKTRFIKGDVINTPNGQATMISQFMRGIRWWCETSGGTYTAETLNRLNPKTE